ncbi:urea ABC transporter permease subunit UrtB [Halarcobacter ebronensis]|uniref:Urea ABC transporter permease subunit UrtB n=1 Tax=Halarcobacter ebronensis TaxID=1462615 RepID=A0A4Q1AYA3_9BACT|nr:urea ABC transporter permease subunit UrtB [Halarcobacter ebronensis]QKF80555.1 urea ABC transporter UrtABCDE, permease protein [Halarcobacter ebronensis]RXK08361.1 urea ABC transporter permease subunit UrtB [Halarcobacter ebronensis]
MKINILKIVFLNLFFLTSLFANFEQDIEKLKTNSLKDKQEVVVQLAETYSEDDRTNLLLTKMEEGDLYYLETTGEFVILEKKEGNTYYSKSLLTGKELEAQDKKIFEKVKTNNKLRSIINSKLAEMNLFSKKDEKRLASSKNILKNLDKDSQELITKALAKETNSDIKEVLTEANTILQAKYSTSTEEQLLAVVQLGDYLSNQTMIALKEIINNENNQPELIKAAKSSLGSVETIRSYYAVVEKAFFGLSLGSVLLLAAIGLAITFGVMKVINMAHGEMMMIGAYTTYTLQQIMPNLMEYSILIAIPCAFIVSGIVGIIIERLVIRYLYGRPLETLLATFGISLILQQLVRTIYSPLNQEVKTPSWMSGAWGINSALSLTYNRLYIIIFAVLVFIGILLVLNKTSLGLKVRAVTQNREMAQAMGIKTSFIDAMTFGIGSGIAGIAGVALSQLTNVGPNLGQAYIVDSFMVVVFGGVGNLWGTLIGAITLGEINKFIEPVAGAVLAKVLILVFIILFIQKRPRGLFPQKGRDAQD